MAEAPIEHLTPRLWPLGPDESTYAILDGARDPGVHPLVAASKLPTRCLYIGDLDPALARVAPYLVQLPRDAPATRMILERAWGASWGVFLRSGAGMNALHRHLRRLLRVEDERRKRMLFRYYDPRVLRVYLPTCLPAELEQMFGPVDVFVVEAEEADRILEFRQQRGVLASGEVRVEKRLAWLGDYLRKERDAEPTKS